MAVSIRERTLPIPFDLSYPLALSLLVAGVLQHTFVPDIGSYAVVVVVYAGVLFAFLYGSPGIFPVDRSYLSLFLLFILLFGASMVLNAALAAVMRYLAVAFFTGILLFVVPRVISLWYYLGAVSRVSAALVVLGFLPYLGFSVQLDVVDFTLWDSSLYWYPGFETITSVFVNPNPFGFLTLSGSIAAIAEWRRYRNRVALALVAINSIGLAFTNYRTGMAAYIAAVGLFTAHAVGGRELLTVAVVSGLSTILVVLLIMFAVLPGPDELVELSLSGRRELWNTAFGLFRDRPLFGYGFGNTAAVMRTLTTQASGQIHNSYLRVFVGLGVGGGVVYLALFFSALFRSLYRSVDTPGVITAVLLTTYFIVQIFNGLTFVGTSLHSSLIALTMGYAVLGPTGSPPE